MKKTPMIIALSLLVVVGIVVAIFIFIFTAAPQSQDQNAGGHKATPETSANTDDHPGATQGDDDAAVSETNEVAIKDFAFSPSKITVKKGTTVTWTNEDSVGHNAIATQSSSGGLPTSASLLKKGESQSHTFTTVGTFTYICGPHPNMKGTVDVVE